LATFGVIGFDRYEALTKFAHQRTLTIRKTVLVVCLVWMSAIVVVIVFCTILPSNCIYFYKPFRHSSYQPHNSRYKVAITLVWITASCCISTCYYLLFTEVRIRNHRHEINTMFGPR
jgi:heme/copper-type cytochrome/quinol oxidase subunit 2